MLVGACLAPKHLEACLRNEAVWQSNGTASQMLSAVSHPGTSPWSSRGSAVVSAAVHHVGDEVHDRSVAAALVQDVGGARCTCCCLGWKAADSLPERGLPVC